MFLTNQSDAGGGVSTLRDAIIGAIATAIVGALIAICVWVWGDFTERLRIKVTEWMIAQLDFFTVQFEKFDNANASWSCPPDSRLVSASCVGIANTEQVAIGPLYRDSTAQQFTCLRYGGQPMQIKATAVCFRVKK